MGDLENARESIRNGELVIYPTETAYGIAVDALNPEAVEKVYEAKQRPKEKGLTVIVKSLAQAEEYAELSPEEKKIAEEFMPGPMTLVTEKTDSVPDNLNEKFVFRVSSSSLARSPAEETPITATSANISGEDTSYSVDDIAEKLLETASYVIDHGRLERQKTSTIAEVNNSEIVIHRRGPVSKEDLEEVLG
ncbi:MAG: L-threonylcarbamoyladenylate synthase [Candidatus Nanohaloarchaea archaeon]